LGTNSPSHYVYDQLQNRIQMSSPGTSIFANQSNLTDFDNYTLKRTDGTLTIGQEKFEDIAGVQTFKNNRIDLLIMVELGVGGSGQACMPREFIDSPITTDIIGAENSCYFSATAGILGKNFIIQEVFHSLYGGNNWHTGNGDGAWTFMTFTNPWGICTQSSGSGMSNVVCGFDRQHLDWKGWSDLTKTTLKTFNTSAIDGLSLQEVNTSNMTPIVNERTYILRDFVTFGDALQLKLPHIERTNNVGPKNQYLWIENHQLLNEFDRNFYQTIYDCGEAWSKGLCAQIQVGKDEKDNSAGHSIFEEWIHETNNSLGSWLFPLTANGNYDYDYEIISNSNWVICNNSDGTYSAMDSGTFAVTNQLSKPYKDKSVNRTFRFV